MTTRLGEIGDMLTSRSKTTVLHGNAIRDVSEYNGWLIGNTPQHQGLGLRYHDNVWLKYGLHDPGETCKNPYEKSNKINISILRSGGPFVHSFKCADGQINLPKAKLSEIGDYVIYGTDVTHTWTAVNESTVLTVKFPPNPNRGLSWPVFLAGFQAWFKRFLY